MFGNWGMHVLFFSSLVTVFCLCVFCCGLFGFVCWDSWFFYPHISAHSFWFWFWFWFWFIIYLFSLKFERKGSGIYINQWHVIKTKVILSPRARDVCGITRHHFSFHESWPHHVILDNGRLWKRGCGWKYRKCLSSFRKYSIGRNISIDRWWVVADGGANGDGRWMLDVVYETTKKYSYRIGNVFLNLRSLTDLSS